MLRLARCVFCLAKGGAEVRFDKNARPYLTCRLCLTRAFVRNLDAIRGLAVAPQLLEAALERRSTDEKYRAWFDGEIARMVSEVRGAHPTQPEAGLPVTPVLPFEEREKVA